MDKKILSEIALYYGNLNMPKGFEIKRDVLVKNISLFQLYIDVDPIPSVEHDKISTYIREYMNLKYKIRLCDFENWGNYFTHNEKTKPLLHIKPQDLKNSADFVCLYGVEIDGDTCQVCINYDDNKRKGLTWNINLTTNKFVIFPSSLMYYITNKNNNCLNYIETITYQEAGR